MTEKSCACMSEWLVWSCRSVLLLHDGNGNLYVNVIQQTSYRQHIESSRIMPCQAGSNAESHEHPSFQTYIYYDNNSELCISYRLHYYNHSEWMILRKGIRGWMPSDSRRFSMRVNARKAITESDCSLSKVRLHLMSEHYQVWSIQPLHAHTHTFNILQLFCFWGSSAFSAPPYLSKLDAGPGCLTASVKLWCGCLILGECIWRYLLLLFWKQVEETRWMEASGSVVETTDVLKMDGESWAGIWSPPISNHAFQWDGSAWWMIFIEERKLKEACHCSHSLVFMGGTKALKFHLLPFTAVDNSDEEFYHNEILCYVDGSLHLMVIYRLNTPQPWPECLNGDAKVKSPVLFLSYIMDINLIFVTLNKSLSRDERIETWKPVSV